PHRKANGSATLLAAIVVGGFREFFVVVWPSEIFDALRHVLADVCLPVRISATAGRNSSSQLANLRRKPAASPTAVPVPSSATFHRAPTPTPIPVLSPSPPPPAAPAASFKSRYRKSAATYMLARPVHDSPRISDER